MKMKSHLFSHTVFAVFFLTLKLRPHGRSFLFYKENTMSYINLSGKVIENDLEDEMSRKHSYNYDYLKHKYPDVYKLPKEEIESMLDIIYEAPTMDDVDSRLDKHINQNKQRWNSGYLQDDIFNRVFNKTLGEEGGYEDNPHRIDTPTNMGIQQCSLDRFKKAHPDLAQSYPINVKDLSYLQVRQIARTDYFDKYRIGEIRHKPLQETMFDLFYNHSPKAPALWAQQAINQNTSTSVNEDGIFGSETINALNNLSPEEIVNVNNAILDKRQADYEHERQINRNPNYINFTTGLPSRFNRFRIK